MATATRSTDNGARDPGLEAYAVPVRGRCARDGLPWRGDRSDLRRTQSIPQVVTVQQSIQWRDPRTGELFLLDPSTGNSRSMQAPPKPGHDPEGAAAGHACDPQHPQLGKHADRRSLKQNGGVAYENSSFESPSWIKTTLEVSSRSAGSRPVNFSRCSLNKVQSFHTHPDGGAIGLS